MKSLRNLATYPTSLSLVADEVLEFHAARLLLLIAICGDGEVLNGLTKMAKLDFFVRYPQFFARAAMALGAEISPSTSNMETESKMVRFHYGPWDQRYYHVLAYLRSKRLIDVTRDGTTIKLALTSLGSQSATALRQGASFAPIVAQMLQVSTVLGKKKGTELKNLVYRLFDNEVAKLSRGEAII